MTAKAAKQRAKRETPPPKASAPARPKPRARAKPQPRTEEKPPDTEGGKGTESPNRPRVGGRPSKYNDDIGAVVVRLISMGHSQRSAAFAVGVHETTILDWRRRHEDFDVAVQRAVFETKNHALLALFNGFDHPKYGPRLALDYLSRRFPREYGGFAEHVGAWDATDAEVKPALAAIADKDLTAALERDDRIERGGDDGNEDESGGTGGGAPSDAG